MTFSEVIEDIVNYRLHCKFVLGINLILILMMMIMIFLTTYFHYSINTNRNFSNDVVLTLRPEDVLY